MGEFQLEREQSLRFAAPHVYQTMVDSFKKFNIHPYDAIGTIKPAKNGYDITIKSANHFSEIATITISKEQALVPDTETENLFQEAAEKCKSLLISDYYKMIKL
ncbi:hypothetical protein RRV45_11610 [Bacillus sp. DTU_2020_1000418_1_SI_GHA_SEK_038]|uniref:hypothetical protein n=1 Tax=Bacillus sp. DTU_2020_1000418_1_SI_GHA_SEK_038 TaxID=3077585 RepID=UPI0028EC078C|nr:hypothetical protein [Bacillus sp. DTU_2020_1000418_1_SI_GHA_SEK_038]WNS73570.1 hypothetical protein RRV45_11610 [Bacillus sp. DTU_2020_1000418_1_SI_GHA_SEK_038]